MRKLLLFGILFLAGYISSAQKVYFIYLESEKAAPFYVRMGDKLYSSSTAGYLILSNLKDSIYTFSVGFVGKRDIEPKFQVTVSAQDHGYLLKELDQKLNLFDLQSLELIAPLATVVIQNEAFITRTDNFTRTLSQAANDPSILLEVVRKEPEKSIAKSKTALNETAIEPAVAKESIAVNRVSVDTLTQNSIDTTALAVAKQEVTNVDTVINKVDTASNATTVTADSTAVAKIDSTGDSLVNGNKVDTAIVADTATKAAVSKEEEKKANEVKAEELKKDEGNLAVVALKDSTNNSQVLVIDSLKTAETKVGEPEYKRSTVVRRSESSTTQGFGLTFIDYTPESSDTIHILIPNPATPFRSANEQKSEVKDKLKTIPGIEATAHIDTATRVDTIIQVSPKMQADSAAVVVKDSSAAVAKAAGSCNQTATERDFRNLRKEMAALETDEGMINTAVVAFKEKCFTTEQVKNLSTLFLESQWKYQFFEAAQKYIADKEHFATLESEIKDENYIIRFKALLAK